MFVLVLFLMVGGSGTTMSIPGYPRVGVCVDAGMYAMKERPQERTEKVLGYICIPGPGN